MRPIVCLFFCLFCGVLLGQSKYQIIDEHHQSFIKELPSEESNTHFGLFDQYISMKMAEWKSKHQSSTVVAQPIDTNFSRVLTNAKRNAFIQFQLQQTYSVNGFVDVYTKVVEGKTSKLNLYESYTVSWKNAPVISSIELIDFEILPGGIVLFAFSFENLVLTPTSTPIELDVYCNLIEKNQRQIPSYFYEIKYEGNSWVDVQYINQFLQSSIITSAKSWSENSNEHFLEVQNVSDWYQNNTNQKSERLTRLSGKFECRGL